LDFILKIIRFAMSQKYQNKYIKIMDIEKPYSKENIAFEEAPWRCADL